jgi:hypothetical protein
MTTMLDSRPATEAPERSREQRMDALGRANVVRTRRAQLKRDLKAGRAQLRALLIDPPEWLLTATVFDLLMALPRWGRVRANRVLNRCRISPSKTLGGMTDRQRRELAGVLGR